MPTPTYDLIASNVLTSSAASVSFSSIPATYRDLVLIIDNKANTATQTFLRVKINADTGSNYSFVYMAGDGGSTFSSSGSGQTSLNGGAVGNTTTNALNTLQFLDFSATDKHKTILERSNNAAKYAWASAHRWASTSAITTIELYTSGGVDWLSGSTFHLYGIA